MEDLRWVAEAKEIASRLNSYVNQEFIDRQLCMYMMEEDEYEKRKIRSSIESLLGIYTPQLLLSKIPPCPSPPDTNGKIVLGNVVQGDRELFPYKIDLQTINKHIAVFGATGSGKTSLVSNFLRQLSKCGIKWLAFDIKRDLRGFVKEDAWVIRWEWLRINPFQPPPGISPKVWMTIVPDIFAHCFYWFSPSENYMLEFLSQLYEKSKDACPTVRDLYDLIVKREERNRKRAEYFGVVTNRLASLLIVLKEVIDVRRSMPLEQIFAHPTVLELDGLRRDETNFLVEYILAYLFYYRLMKGQRSSLSHVIVCDEANRWFYSQRRWKETTVELGMPFIETVPQIIRDYCEGMVFASQGCLSQTVMSNTNLKIVGFLGDGEDIDAISRSLGLSDEERSMIMKLETGYWMVSKAGTRPFIIRSPLTALDKTVTDEELKTRMQPVIAELQKSTIEPTEKDTKTVEPLRIPSLTEDALALIIDVNAHPFKGFAARCPSIGLSIRKAESAKAELVAKGLAKEVGTKLGKSKRLTKFLVLTELGLKVLRRAGYDTSLWRRTGYQNFEHQLYIVLIGYAYKKAGYQIFIEKAVSDDRRVDVIVSNGKQTAIEVELGPFSLENEAKALRYADELIIAVREESVLHETKMELEGLPSEMKNRISIYLIDELLSILRPNYNINTRGNISLEQNKHTSNHIHGNEYGNEGNE
ncbi:MAG: DUF853 family protein [Candidatus Bathyarchaeota archaeon]|nr:DUF853 family protein [Candidatus Bathyarchaeota archaeon]